MIALSFRWIPHIRKSRFGFLQQKVWREVGRNPKMGGFFGAVVPQSDLKRGLAADIEDPFRLADDELDVGRLAFTGFDARLAAVRWRFAAVSGRRFCCWSWLGFWSCFWLGRCCWLWLESC